jgi:serine/threonine protein kinase
LPAQTGSPPFEAQGHSETYRKIRNVDLKFPDNVKPDARDLITKLLAKKPEDRLALSEVPNHPWILKHAPREE